MIADITNSSELPPEERNYISKGLPKSIILDALVSSSALDQMFGHLFLLLKFQFYPIKICRRKIAKKRLQHYL